MEITTSAGPSPLTFIRQADGSICWWLRDDPGVEANGALLWASQSLLMFPCQRSLRRGLVVGGSGMWSQRCEILSLGSIGMDTAWVRAVCVHLQEFGLLHKMCRKLGSVDGQNHGGDRSGLFFLSCGPLGSCSFPMHLPPVTDSLSP